MTFLFGFIAGFWACLLLLLSPCGTLHRAAPTKHNRRYRDAPERNLSREIQAGMAELNERDNEDRVRYEFLGQTGFEE